MIKGALKTISDFVKFGICIFVVLCGVAGYATSFEMEQGFDPYHLLLFAFGLLLLSAGSLALNQVQEVEIDRKMPRTSGRPVASGRLSVKTAAMVAGSLITVGTLMLLSISQLAALLGALTVVLYNGVYTYWWKPNWAYAAVPGAIPGALPITIGYAANSTNIFSPESVYLFLLLFLWQMPHFWALALKFQDDYAMAGLPTLPVAKGREHTLYQMGLYTFVYAGVALAAPLFVHSSWLFLLLVVPMACKILLEFFKLYRSHGQKGWLPFFLWTNFSVLVFVFVPVMDRWNFLFIGSN